MFTVLANTRNSNLYLIAALAIVAVALLTLAVVPAISAPEPALVPITSVSAAGVGSDYYERHPELRVSGAISIDRTGDFFLRHAEWAANAQNAAIPVAGLSEASDYFQRHPEWNVSAVDRADVMGDFSLRHPGWIISIQNVAIPVTGDFGASDYFQRHSELIAPAGIAVDVTDYFLRHPELSALTDTVDFSDYFLRH